MFPHLIPVNDGLPHSATTECGCGPALVFHEGDDGVRQQVFMHLSLRDFDERTEADDAEG